jgi:CRP-like cAMP-binding protein
MVDPVIFRQRFPLLAAGLSEAGMAAFIGTLEERPIAAGEALVREGTASDSLHLVWDGELEVSVAAGSASIHAGSFGPGATLGEVSFFDHQPASATVVAAHPARVLVLSSARLEQLQSQHPLEATEVLCAVARVLATRVRTSSDRLDAALRAETAAARLGEGALLDSLRALLGS